MKLTKYQSGSMGEMLSVAFPLMLSSLSMMAMFFVDRTFLSHYSIEAFNAAARSGTLSWAFMAGWIALGSMAEVFVAQFNGSKQYQKIGAPVWQMIYLSLATFFFFIPMYFWGTELIYGTGIENTMPRKYFSLMMLFAPSFPLYASLAAYYIGRGKVKVITYLAISANLVNAILDYFLIFGIEGWLPSYGIEGAAIATCVSQAFQACVLLILFIRPAAQKNYGTNQWRFNWPLMKQCLKIGVPGALAISTEMFGWGAYYELIKLTGEEALTIASACQSIAILLFFFPEGMYKGITTIVGNLIGANRYDLIEQTIWNGVKLTLYYGALLLCTYWLIPTDYIASHFNLTGGGSYFETTLDLCLLILIANILLENIRFTYYGILTAAGDTNFLLLSNSVTIWIVLILPLYIAVSYFTIDIIAIQLLMLTYIISAIGINYLRFKQGNWRAIQLTKAA